MQTVKLTSETKKKVDVIIPVYNSPEETDRCIKSLYSHLADHIESVHVHDDASDLPTQSVLKILSQSYPNLYIHRSKQNRGFGPGINYAFTFTSCSYILILNSDTRTVGNFLTPLIDALEKNQLLAAINPAGNQFKQKRLNRCQKYDSLVKTNFLSGYAFLIRRKAFDQVNGFNTIYKIGGCEDYEISRQLINCGYWLAIHPTQQIIHLGSVSFNKIRDKSLIVENNRKIYFRRYPIAKSKIILISKVNIYKKLPCNLKSQIQKYTEKGGEVLWICPSEPSDLPSLEVKFLRFSICRLIKFKKRIKDKEYPIVTEIWHVNSVPYLIRLAIRIIFQDCYLTIKKFRDP